MLSVLLRCAFAFTAVNGIRNRGYELYLLKQADAEFFILFFVFNILSSSHNPKYVECRYYFRTEANS